jgi:hypothetical protein
VNFFSAQNVTAIIVPTSSTNWAKRCIQIWFNWMLHARKKQYKSWKT